MYRSFNSACAAAYLASALAGCSAITAADTSLLGGDPAGGTGGTPGALGGDGGGGSTNGAGGIDGAECGCSDTVECTRDTCSGDRCLHVAEHSRCAPEEMCDPIAGCVGREACDSVADCDDGSGCTEDSCEAGLCSNAPVDADGDGDSPEEIDGEMCVGGVDCDDTNRAVKPGATESCNGIDDNCDGEIDEGCGPNVITNDSCSSPTTIRLTGNTATVNTKLDGATKKHSSDCSGVGSDLVYAIAISGIKDVTIDATDSPTPVVLALGDACNNRAFGDGCTPADAPSRIWFHNASPDVAGTLYLLVQAKNGSTGSISFTVTVDTAADDSCNKPLDISGGGTLLGIATDTPPNDSTSRGSCSPQLLPPIAATVRRGVVELSKGGGRVSITASAPGFNAGYAFFARDSCNDEDAEVDCILTPAASTPELDLPLGSGTYSVFIGGVASGPTPYRLQYTP